MDLVVPRLVAVARELNIYRSIKMLPGIELTHVPPETIGALAQRARELGARLIVVHGETIAEPVPPGTNRAAIEAGVHVLAHPGLITLPEVQLAAQKGVLLEITSRKGHSLSNGHVARLARRPGPPWLNSDSHSPADIVALPQRERVVEGAGLDWESLTIMDQTAIRLFDNGSIHPVLKCIPPLLPGFRVVNPEPRLLTLEALDSPKLIGYTLANGSGKLTGGAPGLQIRCAV